MSTVKRVTRHSPVQQQILSLYHKLLKLTKHAPDLQSQVTAEFKQNATQIQRKNSIKIEYEVRRAEKYAELFATRGIREKQSKQYITTVNSTHGGDFSDTSDSTDAQYVQRGSFTKR